MIARTVSIMIMSLRVTRHGSSTGLPVTSALLRDLKDLWYYRLVITHSMDRHVPFSAILYYKTTKSCIRKKTVSKEE